MKNIHCKTVRITNTYLVNYLNGSKRRIGPENLHIPVLQEYQDREQSLKNYMTNLREISQGFETQLVRNLLERAFARTIRLRIITHKLPFCKNK